MAFLSDAIWRNLIHAEKQIFQTYMVDRGGTVPSKNHLNIPFPSS